MTRITSPRGGARGGATGLAVVATAGRQLGRAATVVDESHLDQKPKLGGVRISH